MGKNEVAVTAPMPTDLPKLQFTDNALITLRERYLRKDESGEVVETPEERFWALAYDVASQERPEYVEMYARQFYGIMARGEFMPNSPAIMNAGKGNGNGYSACFVLPIEDSIEGIFSTVKNTALVQKAGGGTGFSFDRLRPTGDYIKSSSGSTSGPLSFWKVLAEATNSIQQGCFTEETLIQTAKLSKKISDIKSGEDVLSYNIREGKYEFKGVECDAFLTRKNAEIVQVTFDNGFSCRCTADHLFLLTNGEYLSAAQLLDNDVVSYTTRNGVSRVTSVTPAGSADVWDITVADNHNFVVVGDAGAGVVAHNSMRRGANMGMMTITHPDILKFISAKQDLAAFNNYNVSVKITDEWMAAYKANPDAPHVVINSRNGKKFFLPKSLKNMTYSIQELVPVEQGCPPSKVWSMRDLFGIIVDCAWRTGEPGLFFIDEVNRYNPTPHIGQIEASNPCVSGDTLILTDTGYHRIDSLVGASVNIWNGKQWSLVTPELTGRDQDLLLVKLSDGSEHKVTKYHKYPIMTNTDAQRPRESRIEAKDLVPGMRLLPFEYPTIDGEVSIPAISAYTKGFFSGDGSKCLGRESGSIVLYGEKKQLLDKLQYRYANGCGGDRVHVELDNSLDWDKTFVPNSTHTVQTRLSWLAGLIDSDGSVTPDGGVQVWSVDKEFLMNVKRMLFITGVGSSLLLGKEAECKSMPDGLGGVKEYHCQKSWRLCIPLWAVSELRSAGLETFRVDISREAKYDTNPIKVVSVEPCGVADRVYCFNEPQNHTGTFDCAVLCNCGEEPLLPYESCNLGSIDVAKFLADDGTYNWDALGLAVHTSVRFLDDVVDASPYPIPEIERSCHANRKIGLGVMGFADLLFKMKLAYNSDAAVTFGGQLMKFVHEQSLGYSTYLASEKGAFPNYKGSLWEKDSALGPTRLIRNATTTTVAPTGTISIFANCSGGMEPLFNLFFFRRVLNGKNLKEVNDYFVAVAKERGFYSPELMDKILAEGTLAHIEGVPEDIKRVFVCAHDIAPEWHIKMQAAFQEHCSASISKTINLTNEATKEDVEKAYLMAWDLKCKGITVYRDGCRALQPMSLKKEEKKVEAGHEHKHRTTEEWKVRRPAKTAPFLPAVRMKQSTPFGTMHITITVDPEIRHEVEIFAQLGKAGETTASDLEAICRMVSMYLRLGGSIVDVIDQFDGIGSNMSVPTKDGRVQSLADGLAKAMRVYHMAKGKYGLEALLLGKVDTSKISLKAGLGGIEDAASAKTSGSTPVPKAPVDQTLPGAGKCPSCSGKMNKSQGCLQCENCGYSKCG